MVTNLLLTVTGEGTVPEQQHGQEHELAVSGAGEDHHPSGLLLDSIVGINVVANVAGGGEGQQFHSHADHGVGEGKLEQLATVGDGFKTEFRKITRARRRYCGGPDGRVQVCLTDLGFSGDEN